MTLIYSKNIDFYIVFYSIHDSNAILFYIVLHWNTYIFSTGIAVFLMLWARSKAFCEANSGKLDFIC